MSKFSVLFVKYLTEFKENPMSIDSFLIIMVEDSRTNLFEEAENDTDKEIIRCFKDLKRETPNHDKSSYHRLIQDLRDENYIWEAWENKETNQTLFNTCGRTTQFQIA